MELYEFARQIATPDYVAAKIASCELNITGRQTAIVIGLGILVICGAVAVLTRRFVKDEDARWGLYLASGLVAVIASVALLVNAGSLGNAYQAFAAWSNDPVTHVVTNLATKL